MIEEKNLVGKEIISIYDCQSFGKSSGMYITKRKKCAYIALSYNDISYILPTKSIVEHSSDCIMIRNKSVLQPICNMAKELEECSLLTSAKAYTLSGKDLGCISNVILDEKYNITSIATSSGDNVDSSNIFNLRDGICIVRNDSPANLNKYKPRSVPKPKAKHQEIIVSALSDNNSNIAPEQKTETQQINIPQKKISPAAKISISDTSILLDRVVTKRIIANNGEIIAREKAKITKDIIRMARINGKLYELVRYSI